MDPNEIRNRLVEKGLKVTPQRLAVLEAIMMLDNHPAAEKIIDYIRKNHPNISTATVYKVLDAFVSCGLIKKVKTETGIMRYDPMLESHHHIYFSDSDRIEDYRDDELNLMLANYFSTKAIPGIEIKDMTLHITVKRILN